MYTYCTSREKHLYNNSENMTFFCWGLPCKPQEMLKTEACA